MKTKPGKYLGHRWRISLASLCLSVALLGSTTLVRAALPEAPAGEVEVSDAAREHFQLGVSWLQDPDGARYEEAYKEF